MTILYIVGGTFIASVVLTATAISVLEWSIGKVSK